MQKEDVDCFSQTLQAGEKIAAGIRREQQVKKYFISAGHMVSRHPAAGVRPAMITRGESTPQHYSLGKIDECIGH
jgi:hypothetical protein